MRRPIVTIATLAIATLALAGTAAAQTGHAGHAPLPAPAAPSLDDATIIAIFDAANTADIETGQLAAARGASREVREFGAMLARDHQKVRQLGRDLAKQLSVTPTPPKDDAGARDHAAAMKRLRALRGAAFDRAFLQHEAAFHAAVIAVVQKSVLPAVRNAELKALVVKVAPAFEAHMLAARDLEQKLLANGAGNHGH